MSTSHGRPAGAVVRSTHHPTRRTRRPSAAALAGAPGEPRASPVAPLHSVGGSGGSSRRSAGRQHASTVGKTRTRPHVYPGFILFIFRVIFSTHALLGKPKKKSLPTESTGITLAWVPLLFPGKKWKESPTSRCDAVIFGLLAVRPYVNRCVARPVQRHHVFALAGESLWAAGHVAHRRPPTLAGALLDHSDRAFVE